MQIGNVVTLVAAGTCTRTASSAGNATFLPLNQALRFAAAAAATPPQTIGIPTLPQCRLIVLAQHARRLCSAAPAARMSAQRCEEVVIEAARAALVVEATRAAFESAIG